MTSTSAAKAIAAARTAMVIDAAAIEDGLHAAMEHLPRALAVLAGTTGRVIVSGLGKSGHIAGKIAATMSSTGTPAQFVHAAEALHGDSGARGPGDSAVLISYSGETSEVCAFAQILRRAGVPIVAMCASRTATLAQLGTAWLPIAVEREADPLGVAPTASAAVTLAVGDALAAGLMTLRGFTKDDFAARHPGGSLGDQLERELGR